MGYFSSAVCQHLRYSYFIITTWHLKQPPKKFMPFFTWHQLWKSTSKVFSQAKKDLYKWSHSLCSLKNSIQGDFFVFFFLSLLPALERQTKQAEQIILIFSQIPDKQDAWTVPAALNTVTKLHLYLLCEWRLQPTPPFLGQDHDNTFWLSGHQLSASEKGFAFWLCLTVYFAPSSCCCDLLSLHPLVLGSNNPTAFLSSLVLI